MENIVDETTMEEFTNGEELMNTDLVPVDKGTEYEIQSSAQLVPDVRPDEVIERAKEQARALMDVIEQQQLYSVIRGKKYIHVEGWQLLAAFNGLSPVIESTEEIEKDGAKGYKARCVIYNAEGREVGAGEAMCMNDESKATWQKADDYARKSMAQTRAISKACRTILSFVVVLAGYEPTPFEEMVGVFDNEDSKEQVIVTIKKLSSQERIAAFLEKNDWQSLNEVPLAQLKAIVKKLKSE